jgi:hypothetical protein
MLKLNLYPKNLSIEEKIALADYLWKGYGEDLAADDEINRLLGVYRKEILRTYELMKTLKVVNECTVCATRVAGGGCCGAGIEDWYDELILLLNLLLGKQIPTQRLNQNDCFFLGHNGCQLFARHHFCVNYLCPRIIDLLSQSELSALRAQSGKELFRCWELERLLRAKFDNQKWKKGPDIQN